MTTGSARIPVLPRAIAASITVSAVARGGWAIAAATLVVSVPGLISLYVRDGYGPDLAVPLISIGVMLALLVYLSLRPSGLAIVLYAVVGAACVYSYLHGVLDVHPAIVESALILVNRPATALVLIGTSGSRPLRAVAWGICGFLLAEGVTVLVSLQLDIPIRLGNGPAITLANYSAAYLGLSLIQRAQRGRVPDFLRLRQETRKIEAARTVEHRATALLHDTVLNDLALVINGPDVLDERMRAAMRSDVATLADPLLLSNPKVEGFVDAGDVSMRNRLTALVSDFQWRGLTLEVTGDTGSVVHATPEVIDAAVGALRASFENVLRHSGATAAEVIVSSTGTTVTWIVSDAGVGFDIAGVPADRLGLSSSILRRVELAGGFAKVWSTPGNGTSVMITLPVRATPVAKLGDAIVGDAASGEAPVGKAPVGDRDA